MRSCRLADLSELGVRGAKSAARASSLIAFGFCWIPPLPLLLSPTLDHVCWGPSTVGLLIGVPRRDPLRLRLLRSSCEIWLALRSSSALLLPTEPEGDRGGGGSDVGSAASGCQRP